MLWIMSRGTVSYSLQSQARGLACVRYLERDKWVSKQLGMNDQADECEE